MARRRKPKEIEEDPVVAEVRRWRAQVFKGAGGTLAGLIKLLDKPRVAKKTRRRSRSKAEADELRPRRRKAG
jgi:hypothetical protein